MNSAEEIKRSTLSKNSPEIGSWATNLDNLHASALSQFNLTSFLFFRSPNFQIILLTPSSFPDFSLFSFRLME